MRSSLPLMSISGHLYGSRADGIEGKEDEGDERGLQEVQRECAVQEAGGHTRGTLPMSPPSTVYFFCTCYFEY